MKAIGIIGEYNPFHNGHKYQLDKVRELTCCDAVVALMSGSFVQRGDFAIYDKNIRAEAAVLCGADLVLENPSAFVLRSAEGYASAAVYTLDSLGCVDYLVFGAEHESLSDLQSIAALFADETPEFKRLLTAELAEGIPYAAARASAADKILGGGTAEILCRPNNLLAIEYLKALIKHKSDIQPVLIQRIGTGHHDTESRGIYASASYIRSILPESLLGVRDLVPSSAFDLYKGSKPFDRTAADKAILSALCLISRERLSEVPDISEGLENKIKSAAMTAESLDELTAEVKSKRYAYARIRRALLCAYLGITRGNSPSLPLYIKILCFSEVGRAVIRLAKSTSSLSVAKNASAVLKDKAALKLWKSELELDRVYEIMSQYRGII